MQENLENRTQFAEELVRDVVEDFKARQNARQKIEAQWRLNLDFLDGKQYSFITSSGDVIEGEEGYYWQSRNVYNHILPVLDTRLSKLSRIRPTMGIRSASEDDSDIYTAKLSAKLLNSTYARLDMDEIISSATRWSEATGTSFYRIGWNKGAGQKLGVLDGADVYEGDVIIETLSPFEIFPDDLSKENLEECASIIRARVLPVKEIYEAFGKEISSESTFTLKGDVDTPSALLIERYEKPCKKFPKGRIVTVAGGVLLSVEEFPYVNGALGGRIYPFVRQISQSLPGNFFGRSVIDRLIPVQRAYNAVRNRKHEYLSRISMGVLTVEDGSVDTDALIEEGLQPGKIIVYRQGSEAPKMMEAESLPSDFEKEEEKLLDEFVLLGGVNEVSQNYKATLGVTSAAGLQLLLEQDDERLNVSTENIRRSVKEVAKHVIRLFKQYTSGARLMRASGEGGKAEVFYFTSQDITSDDVIFETESELSFSPSQRRSNILELVASGILNDENGKINPSTKVKLLELMGFGGLEISKSADAMHLSRAEEENVSANEQEPCVESYDDHEIHIVEHTRFLVGKGYTRFENPQKIKERIEKHLFDHRAKAEEKAMAKNSVEGIKTP